MPKHFSVSLFALFVSLFLFITSTFSISFTRFLYIFFVFITLICFSIHLSSLLGFFICLYVSLSCTFFPIRSRSSFYIHSLNQNGHPPAYLKWVTLNFKFTLRRYASVTWLGILCVHWFYFLGQRREVMALAARNLDARLKGTGQNERSIHSQAWIVASVITR